jgi:hypothetical protein
MRDISRFYEIPSHICMVLVKQPQSFHIFFSFLYCCFELFSKGCSEKATKYKSEYLSVFPSQSLNDLIQTTCYRRVLNNYLKPVEDS